MADWKNSVNLPRTDFPMKANLQVTEPAAIARWEAMDLYGQIARARAGSPKYVLHDGPPYANGQIHIGHALNKVLKDLVVKSRSMAGFDAPYVPGWDCHGLPIELQVDKELGSKKRDMSLADFRRACRAYAQRHVAEQCADFKRLGVFGDWGHPYLTMQYEYQAAIVRALGACVGQGLVYKGKKPVYWCISDRTALAEAEVEYEPHTSPSIYVEFRLDPRDAATLAGRVPGLGRRDVSVLIWTTTPWTIPSNLAVAFHPAYDYAAYDVDGRLVIVAEALAAATFAVAGRAPGEPVARATGEVFDTIRFVHPLYARASLGVLADYVTLEQGTGVVHTAPGHGADDFATGQRYGLETYAPIGPSGHFLDSVELFAGQKVWDANPKVVEALRERGALWHTETYEHSYPHCWRCHTPLIFLATPQWFIAMDGDRYRERALEAVTTVEWLPAWGEERIHNMLANRPDWCISRQRAWGVPIPAVTCTTCRESVLTTALTDRAAAVFLEDGADAWYERPIGDFLPDGLTCAHCGGTEFDRERDILDVWFDSGTSHEAVLAVRPELRWPADMYLEGSDQYRGWFHSSLLVALGTRGQAPYRSVITHGFVVDEDGRKMSKSRGNVVSPQQVIEQSGAEVLRLWVAMVDYTEEVRLGKQVLARTVEAYRKIRNTLRYLVANLDGFDPATDVVPADRLLEVDRYALARYAQAAARMRTAYDGFDFQAIFHEINRLTVVDLSAFYFDVSKDRLYTFGATAEARRSAQTAIYVIADGLTRLLAPVLPITADELWRVLPGPREASVHLALFPDDVGTWSDEALVERFAALLDLRELVNGKLETQRQAKVIGTSLEADVTLAGTGRFADALALDPDTLATLCIVSRATVTTPSPDQADDTLDVQVSRASGVKCQRCWRYVDAISDQTESEGLCDRCADALGLARGAVPA
ncbi:MAG: isoleucine--tRNA ligase [Luteitalea sp.]